MLMHQLIPPAPSPPPPLRQLRGICPPCQSRGPGICQPPGQSQAFDMHAVSYQNINNYNEGFTGRKADWLICHGQE